MKLKYPLFYIKFAIFSLLLLFVLTDSAESQTYWRSYRAGNWNGSGNWEKSTDGGNIWVVTGYPSATNDCIEFINHAMVLNISVGITECWVASNGSLTINSGCTLTMNSGSSGNKFEIDGTCTNNGTVTIGSGINSYIYGTMTNSGTVNNSGNFSVSTDYTLYGSLTNSSGSTFNNGSTVTVQSGCTFTNSGTFYNRITTTAGTLTVSGGGTFTNNGTLTNTTSGSANCTINVYGTFANSVNLSTNGTITVYSGGTYKHMFTSTQGTIPTCTWNTGSTCEIAGYTCSANISSGYGQSFYNLKWNCTNCTCDQTWDLPATLTVLGDFTLASTGTYYTTGLPNRLNMGWSNNSTINVGGNMYVTGGYWYGNLGGKYLTINVTGNYSQSGGKFVNATANVSGNTFTVNGNFTLSGTSRFDINNSSSSYVVNLIVKGDFSLAANDTIYAAYTSLIKFNKTGTQSFTNNGVFSGPIQYSVESGSILSFASATTTIANSNASSTFTVQSGGGLKILHASGISTTASTGCVQVGGTQTYSTSGNYEYSASVTQVTGNALPTTVNKFKKSGTSTTTLTAASLTVSDTANWSAGTLDISGKTLTMNGVITSTSGTLNSSSTSTLAIVGTGACTLPSISGGYISITLNRSGTTVALTGAINIVNLVLQAGTLDLGSNSLTLNGDITNSGGSLTIQSTSSISFGGSGAKIILPSSVSALNNLTINRANGVDLNSDLTVSGTLTLTAGAFSIGAHTLTIGGLITTTSGTLTGGSSSNISFGGSGATTTLPAVSGGLNNLTINRANGITLGSSMTLAGTLTLSSGALSLGAGNTFTLNGDISVTSGSLTGSATTDFVIGGTGTALTLPTVTFRNLTINRANGVLLGNTLTLNGDLTLSSGNLTVGAYTLQLSGNLYTTGGNILTTSSSSIEILGAATPSALTLPSNITSLNNFKLNRTNGVTLSSNLTVNGTLTMVLGAITLNSYSIIYNTGATLTYSPSSSITMSDSEYPAANGPTTIIFTTGTTTLDKSRTISQAVTTTGGTLSLGTSHDLTIIGALTLTSGYITIGTNTLTLSGTVSRTSGSITGSTTSNLVINGSGANVPLYTNGNYYNNLTIDRANGVTMSNYIKVEGTLNMINGTLTVGSLELFLDGSYTSTSGTISTTTSSLIYVQGSGSNFSLPSCFTSIGKLTVNRANGVTLTGPLTVNSASGLTLTSGILTTTAVNLLTLNTSATVSGGSTTSFVSGPMAKIIASTTAFTFPIGKGSSYLPVVITPNVATSTTFQAEYLSTQQSYGSSLGTGIAVISSRDYYEISRTAGAANAYITLSWNANSQVSTLADLRVGHWTGTQWENLGNSATTGTVSSGTVKTTTYVSSFSPFILASSTGNNPLPVELTSFNANSNDRNITLFWETSSETNNAGFEIQKLEVRNQNSEWKNVGFVAGKGTTNIQTNYSFEDKKLSTGKYKYRLKQIDNNGNFEYYNLNGEVEIELPKKYELSQNYPNPFNPTTNVDISIPVDGKVSLKIYDITGKEILSIMNDEFKAAGFYTIIMNVSRLSSGVYFYRMTSDKFNQVKKMMVLK